MAAPSLYLSEPLSSLVRSKYASAQTSGALIFSSTHLAIIRSNGIPVMPSSDSNQRSLTSAPSFSYDGVLHLRKNPLEKTSTKNRRTIVMPPRKIRNPIPSNIPLLNY